MMELERVATFALTTLLVELTPGPNMGYLAAVSARYGRTAGLFVVAGVAAGLAIDLTAALTGISAVLIAQPFIYEIVRWAGVAVMVWLAVDALRSSAGWSGEDPAAEAPRQLFTRGVVTNMLNAKAILFMVTVLPTFLDPGRQDLAWQAVTVGVIYLAIATGVHVAIVLLSSLPIFVRLNRRNSVGAARAYAVSLLLVAAWLAYATASPTVRFG